MKLRTIASSLRSMPCSCNTSSRRHRVRRGAPTVFTTSAGALYFNSRQPARSRRLAASSSFSAMASRCITDTGTSH